MYIPSSFGERLREIRKNLKLTQIKFGEMFGLSHPHISNVETGKENPSEMFILFIIEKLNIDEQWLRTGISPGDSPQDDFKSIGGRIKETRKSLNLSQGEFGKPLGISHAHISKIEAGKGNPSETLILLMTKTFDIDEQWLRTGIRQDNSHGL